MRKLKFLWLSLLISLFAFTPAFASVGVKVNGVMQGTATDINFTGPSGTTLTNDGSAWNVPVISSTLVATGIANGGATSMTTTDLAVPTSYAYVRKAIASDSNYFSGTLANGTPGQILGIFITSVAGSGTFTITPTTATGITSIKFTAAKQSAVLLYVNNTVGWVLLDYNGATVNIP